MITYLAPGRSRRMTAANFAFYPEATLHPDRIMKDHDFVFLLEGRWEICQDGQVYLLEPGDVLHLAAGRHHYGETPCLPGTRTMYLHMSADPADGTPDPGFPAIPTLTKASSPGLRRDFEGIISTCFSRSSLRDVRISALADLLLCDLAQAGMDAAGQWPVSAVRAILISHPEINYTAADLAARLGLTERSLRYLFREACGIPLHRYQLDLRLDMAHQLLDSEPDRTLSDVAETFGFTDAFHLSHAYKRRFGRSPKAR